MALPKSPSAQNRARELRRNMTPQEQRLWHCFLKQYPMKFYRQKPIGRYIVDFYCRKAMLIVELDGGQHLDEKGMLHDRHRTAYLNDLGFSVIRYTNTQVNLEFESVCNDIDRIVRSRI